MSKDSDLLEAIVGFGLVLGSIWLGSEAIKSLSQETKPCKKCGMEIPKIAIICQHCGGSQL